MATAAMALDQFQRLLSCNLGTGFHTCDLAIGLYKNQLTVKNLILAWNSMAHPF